jgi:hypothetical protein
MPAKRVFPNRTIELFEPCVAARAAVLAAKIALQADGATLAEAVFRNFATRASPV